ncbi:MAG: glycosyltransferase family 8 protein [Actinobacteria bacterium]|nr:glycosyltransferase family 8 protein [Actinomycetota bacterium]
MNEPIRHVVVATDENFIIPTATALRSLSLNDSGMVTVWVLASGVPDPERRRIEQSVVGTMTAIEWVDMESAQLGDTSGSPIGRATYFRLAIGDLLPSSVRKVLYLDVDVLVVDSLAPLWDRPLEQHQVIAAVRSVHFPSMCTYGAMDHWPQLGLDPRAPYFNAGVMMIDLEGWRALDVGRRCLEHLASPLANGSLADQEALNVVLAGRWGELDPRWNQQSPFLERNRGVEALYPDEVIRAAREHPAVIHFLNRPKPWHRDCTHPARGAWQAVANDTAFAPIALERTSVTAQAKWRIRRAASALVRGR